MDTNLALSKEAINNKCFTCGNILSVPPITSISSCEELYVCGRCKHVDCKPFPRNTLFENVAQFLSFPCTYENCEQKIAWGLVEDHEKVCTYRTIRCPVYYQNCDDEIVVEEIDSHFKEKHKANIKTFEQWNLNTGFDYVFLAKMEGFNFLVYILHLNNLSSVGVFSLNPLSKYVKYNVKLSSSVEEEFFVIYENQNIFPYDERQHCYKCLRKLCHLKRHPFSEDNKSAEMSLGGFTKKINENILKTVSGIKGDIKYIISLMEEDKTPEQNNNISVMDDNDVTMSDKTKITSQSKTDSFRKGFECPVCEEYLTGPIYSCNVGHSICNVCKPRLKKCPLCAMELGNLRNFTLERIVESVELFCQYHSNGCTFNGNTEKLFKHEINCTYK